MDFHQAIAKAGANRYLGITHSNLRLQIERYSYIAVNADNTDRESLDAHYQKIKTQHRELVDCIRSKNKERIEQIAVDHIRLFQQRIVDDLMNISFL